jgi:HEAT repeat protein
MKELTIEPGKWSWSKPKKPFLQEYAALTKQRADEGENHGTKQKKPSLGTLFTDWFEKNAPTSIVERLAAEGPRGTLRVVHPTAHNLKETSRWPWERFCHGAFLATNEGLGGRAVYHQPEMEGSAPQERAGPLIPVQARALVLVCADVLHEKKHMRFRQLCEEFESACLGGYLNRHESKLVVVDGHSRRGEYRRKEGRLGLPTATLTRADKKDVREILKEGWDLIHVVSHGSATTLEIGGVILRPRDLLPSENAAHQPRFVFLQACKAGPHFGRELLSARRATVSGYRGVEGVLGFGDDVRQLYIPALFRSFYRNIRSNACEIAALLREEMYRIVTADAYLLQLWTWSPRTALFPKLPELLEGAIVRHWSQGEGASFPPLVSPIPLRPFETPHYVPPAFVEIGASEEELATPRKTPERPHRLSAAWVLHRLWPTRPDSRQAWVFVGEQGAGKSLWLKYAAHQWASRQVIGAPPALPLLVPLDRLAATGSPKELEAALFGHFAMSTDLFPSLPAAVAYALQDGPGNGDPHGPLAPARKALHGLFRMRLMSQDVLLLLDGSEQHMASALPPHLATSLPRHWTVLLTCGPTFVVPLLRGLGLAQRDPLVCRFLPLSRQDQGDLQLGRRAIDNPATRTLLANPFLLSVARSGKISAPKSEVELLEALVTQSLSVRVADWAESPVEAAPRIALEAVAWHAVVEDDSGTISTNRVTKICRKATEGLNVDPEELRRSLLGSALLNRVAEGSGWHRFVHDAVAHYLAARHLLDLVLGDTEASASSRGSTGRDLLMTLVTDPDKWPVLRLYAALLDSSRTDLTKTRRKRLADGLLTLVLTQQVGANAWLDHLRGYLVGMIGAELWELCKNRRAEIRHLVKKDDGGSQRPSPGTEPAISGLPFLLRVDSAEAVQAVRNEQSRLLLAARGEKVEVAAVTHLHNVKSAAPLARLVAVVVELQPDGAVEAIVERYLKEVDPAVRTMLLDTLGFLPLTEGPSLGLLGTEAVRAELPIRLAAVRALGRLAAPGCRKTIVDCAQADQPSAVRITALRQLGRASLAAGDIDRLADQCGVVEQSLKDPSPAVREAACGALAELGTEFAGARRILESCIDSPFEAGVEVEAALARSRLGPWPAAHQILATHPSREFDQRVGGWFVRSQMKGSADWLLGQLKAPEIHRRIWAADKLAWLVSNGKEDRALGHRELCKAALDRLPNEPHPAVRERLLVAAGSAPGRHAIGRFCDYVRAEPSERIRCLAAWSLALIDSDLAEQALEDLLDEPEELAAESAALALGTCRHDDALTALHEGLQRPVRSIALCAAIGIFWQEGLSRPERRGRLNKSCRDLLAKISSTRAELTDSECTLLHYLLASQVPYGPRAALDMRLGGRS